MKGIMNIELFQFLIGIFLEIFNDCRGIFCNSETEFKNSPLQ